MDAISVNMLLILCYTTSDLHSFILVKGIYSHALVMNLVKCVYSYDGMADGPTSP